ncbi:hypothetical protein Q3V30_12950 [Erwinia pyri]|uniref:Uncharacterized protein n=1 Tax=Erwinia pyri TaxID=3062598 RepID=A0AA50HP03_9GAMM|nr:hypothetical protein [Erwinia sp. DE2]WLS77393.1 hypothetical protein Q3V30_12950 [Erwinia sp. DE2]
MNAYVSQDRLKDQHDAAEQQEAQRVSRVDVIALDLANKYPEDITDFAAMLNLPVELRMFLRGSQAQDEYADFVDRLSRLQAEEHDQLIEIGFMEEH